ncbi:MAG: hydroxymethylbilane synthase [Deltaproteobacteria bacterium]|nr:MAG: hydroxymethylbilane synthase [Deltaproteobacteria bacterium]
MMDRNIHIGTRGSKLALWQANWVQSELLKAHPNLSVQIIIIKTKGDKILDVPLAKVGGKGLFVKEIEDALLEGKIDLAVHSMKDMPAELPKGLTIGAIPQRENPQDVLVSKRGCLADLPEGARIGTSSLRRASQILFTRPDIYIHPLRGNLDTRLKKLDAGDMDAIVLAAAGILRLGLKHRITEYLDSSIMLPAAGQGALCVEVRTGDEDTGTLVGELDHAETRTVVLGERTFLHRLGGSCQVPIAAYGRIEGGRYELSGLIAESDGSRVFRADLAGPAASSGTIGAELAEKLIGQGAMAIIEKLQRESQ